MCEAATACGTGCPEGRLCPRGARGNSWELLAVTAGGGQGEPLAFRRQRPEMLLSTPTAHTGSPPPAQQAIVNSAEAEKSWARRSWQL